MSTPGRRHHRLDNWLRSAGGAGSGARPPDPTPSMAAVLVLQPIGLQPGEHARLARSLVGAGCRALDQDARALVAEFGSALDALDLALRLLSERAETLRAGLSVGSVERIDGRLAGLAVADARNALKFAGPGSLALGSRLTPSMIEDVRPDLAHMLRPVTAVGRDAQPMAFVAEAPSLATLSTELLIAASARRRFSGERRALAITAGAVLLAVVAWLVGRALLRDPPGAATSTPPRAAALLQP